MQDQPTNHDDGPVISSGPQRRRLPWRGPSIYAVLDLVGITIPVAGLGWYLWGVAGAIIPGFICVLVIIFGAVQELLLPSPRSDAETKAPDAERTHSRPDDRQWLKIFRWSIRAKTAPVREFVARAGAPTRRAVVAGAIVGAITGGCFQVIVHAVPDGLRVRAIVDAVTGAAGFALVGAMLAALVDSLAAPFLKRFDGRSAKLRVTCGAMCGAIIGALAVAVFGVVVVTIEVVTAKAENPHLRWQDAKIPEWVVNAILIPMTWGAFIGAISGLYAARGRSVD